jgi:hypothetical protein
MAVAPERSWDAGWLLQPTMPREMPATAAAIKWFAIFVFISNFLSIGRAERRSSRALRYLDNYACGVDGLR